MAANSLLKVRITPWGVATAAGSLACVCSLSGFAGQFYWLLDLTAHFRAQYAGVLLLLGSVLLIARRRKPALVFLAFAILNLLLVLYHAFTGRPQIPPGGEPFRVMLLNVRTENEQYAHVRQEIALKKPALVVFEEVDDRWLAELAPLSGEYPYRLAEPRDDNFGIALLSRFPLHSSNIVYLASAEVPSVLATVRIQGRAVVLVGTHPLPPASRQNTQLRDQQLAAISRLLANRKESVVLLGDLNTTPWSHSFRRLLRDAHLLDSSRGFGWQPTWPTYLWPMRIPIDHCLLSRDLQAVSRHVGPGIGSDHLPLTVDVLFSP